jgi:hypothetical protein
MSEGGANDPKYEAALKKERMEQAMKATEEGVATGRSLRDMDIKVANIVPLLARTELVQQTANNHWVDADFSDHYSDYDEGENADPLHGGHPTPLPPINTDDPWE